MQAVLCYSSTILLPLVVIVTFLLLESFSVRLAEEERLCLLKYCLKYTLSFPTVASALLFYRICFVLFFFSFFFLADWTVCYRIPYFYFVTVVQAKLVVF